MIYKSHEGAIAVIGMSCRFPNARNVSEFWYNLQHGVDSVTDFTDEQLIAAGVERELINDPNYVKSRPVLTDIDKFDAEFFNFTRREAEITDPQQRLFLECAWEAFEDASCNPINNGRNTSVYAGTGFINNYYEKCLFLNKELRSSAGEYAIAIGNKPDFLATRLAYKLGLNGACMTVQTACSTSLVAVSMASQALSNYDCDMALAGGAAISIPQNTGYLYQPGMILSSDGRCRAFDAKAQGTVSGSGVGVVLLKRLEDAITDKDRIHAIIKGSAINNDGSNKIGYTGASVMGQASVIEQALASAEVHPETITYIEAHGTGTLLGDPIEILALTKAFRNRTNKKCYCAIGSVKTNIGHLDAASGIAGLIKTVLCLKNKQLVPTLHYENPNPHIDFVNSPFYVNDKSQEWARNNFPRRAGVSSFGIGGTNAHVVLEEYIDPTDCKYMSVRSRVWNRQSYWIEPPIIDQPSLIQTNTQSYDLLSVVLSAWKECLGLEEVNNDADFFDLGGDSLIAIDLLSRIGKEICKAIDPNSLIVAPTINKLVELISSDRQQTSLVPITEGTQKEPLFLIHPVGGNVYFYRDLVMSLNSNRKVYGIQSASELNSIEAMATQYVNDLLIVQPEGNYYLGGSSFGGIVAYEMAQQLTRLGKTINLLTLIDTPGVNQMPDILDKDWTYILGYLLNVGLNTSGNVLKHTLNHEAKLLYFLEKAKESNVLIPPSFGLTEIKKYLQLFEHHIKLMFKYVPRKYSGRILYFRARESDDVNPLNPEVPWSELTDGRIEIVEVPGNHITMHFPPNVQVLARNLRIRLRGRT